MHYRIFIFAAVCLCLGDCFVEKSSREAEEKKLPPALRVSRAPNPAGNCRAARDVRAGLRTDNTCRRTTARHCWTARDVRPAPTLFLDWEMSVFINTRNTPSGIPLPRPPHHFTASGVSCPSSLFRAPSQDVDTLAYRCTQSESAECYMSRQARKTNQPK